MSEPLIFDTSVWIDFLKNKGNPEADLLTSYIDRDDQVLLIPTILQEVLQGIREDKQYTHVKEIFSYFTVLQIPPVQAAIGAAELYRGLRKKGLTIRKSNDCLIWNRQDLIWQLGLTLSYHTFSQPQKSDHEISN